MTPPRVSILIPAYNAEDCLRETVESAVNQTWPRKEVIVVDDGSTDHTLEVARRVESRLVRVITQEKEGACAARNRALREAQGDFIQWLDADDLLDPTKIEAQLADQEDREDETLHTCRVAMFFRFPRAGRVVSNELCRDLNAVDWLVTAIRTGHWLAPHAWLLSRRLVERAGPWDERLALNQDGEYFTRCVSQGKVVRFHSDALCFYRIGNPRSLSRVRSSTALESLLLSVELSIDHLGRRESGRRGRDAALAFLQYNVDTFRVRDPLLWEKFVAYAKVLGGDVRPSYERAGVKVLRMLLGDRVVERFRSGMAQAKLAGLRGYEGLRAVWHKEG